MRRESPHADHVEAQAEGVELDTVLLQVLEHVPEKAEELVTA